MYSIFAFLLIIKDKLFEMIKDKLLFKQDWFFSKATTASLKWGWIYKKEMTVCLGPVEADSNNTFYISPDQVLRMRLKLYNDASIEVNKIDSVPCYSVTDKDMGQVKISGDDRTVDFIPSGKLGEAVVAVLVDSDITEGETALLGTVKVQVIESLPDELDKIIV